MTYFDIFHYPMTSAEIRAHLDMPCTEQELAGALAALMKEKILFKTQGYYQLKHDDSLLTARLAANKLAEKHLVKARKIAAFLSWFPFVKGIAISGSLSKKVATSDSDYDFFVIAEKDYLWICRSVFFTFIKLVSLFGFKKYFCLNYTVDESYLEISEKNIFTATEIATLMPVYGMQCFAGFFAANEWIYRFFPNHPPIEYRHPEKSKSFTSRLIEKVFRNRRGQKIDDALMRYFERRWEKLQSKHVVTNSGYVLGSMMVGKHYCKPYPQHFQQKVLSMHEEKMQKLFSAIVLKSVA